MRFWLGLLAVAGCYDDDGPALGLAEWSSVGQPPGAHRIESVTKVWAYARITETGWVLGTLGRPEENPGLHCGDVFHEIHVPHVGELWMLGSRAALDAPGTVPVVPARQGEPEVSRISLHIGIHSFISGHAELTEVEDAIVGTLEALEQDGLTTVFANFTAPICAAEFRPAG